MVKYHGQVHVRVRDRAGMDGGVLFWDITEGMCGHEAAPGLGGTCHLSMLRAMPFPPELLCFLCLKHAGSGRDSE